LFSSWLSLAALACGDDNVIVTESDAGSGTGTGTSVGESSSSGDPPTTSQPPTTTEGGMTLGTMSEATTTPTTGDTTVGVDTDTSTTGTSTGDDSTSTGDTDDTTTGVEVTGRSVSQTVNAGHLVQSPNFRLVFTMGQPTQNQATTSSPNFKLRGGLVGANGSPP
jgi:hypothetical protein